MNIGGLYLGPVSSFAYRWGDELKGVVSRTWECRPKDLPFVWSHWCEELHLGRYDRVRLWTPKELQPAALYRLAADTLGDRLEPVSPQQLRESLGLEALTVRDYVQTAQRALRHVGGLEAAVAVLLAADRPAEAGA